MKKKTTWIKISQLLVTAVPPVVVLCVKFPEFIKTTGASISAAGLLVGIILALIFRDQTKKLFQTPSAFKTCLVIFLLSLIAVNLGEQCLWISATALISGACGVPLQMWYNHEKNPESTDDILKGIQNLLKKNSSESEDSNNEKS